MSKEIVTITDPQRLVEFADENDILFHLTQNEALLLFKYVHFTNHNTYRALGEREGQLFMKKGTMHEDEISGGKIFHDAEWVPVTIDEVVDEICEMNYELRSEILERLEEREVDFIDRSVYESLIKDCKRLDAMFARTEFSKKLDEMAKRMAGEAIQSYLEKWERKENLGKDEVEKMPEEVEAEESEFLQEQKQPTPDELVTGEKAATPRGSFSVTAMTREQIEAAGYGFHHQSDDEKYLIMGNGTQAFAVAVEQKNMNMNFRRGGR